MKLAERILLQRVKVETDLSEVFRKGLAEEGKLNRHLIDEKGQPAT